MARKDDGAEHPDLEAASLAAPSPDLRAASPGTLNPPGDSIGQEVAS
jgi:hypothetical protein